MTAQTSPAEPPAPPPRWVRVLALAGPLALVASLGVVYVAGGFGKATGLACKDGAATAARLAPLVQGEVAAFGVARAPRPAPTLLFKDADGVDRSLADFRGRTVLLNLWATWCVPCRKEMPALDRLQASRGGADFQVVAVNTDTAKLDRPRQFLRDAGIEALPLYTESTGTAFQTMRSDGALLGLPTTLLIDRNGCAVGTMAGPAEWDSADARKLIDAATASTSLPPT